MLHAHDGAGESRAGGGAEQAARRAKLWHKLTGAPGPRPVTASSDHPNALSTVTGRKGPTKAP